MAGKQHQQWVSIDSVVNMYLDRSEQGNNKYFKCWQLAFQGMQQLGLDFFYTVKSVKLPVNANLTVNIPEDYLQYTKVGVFNDRGEVIPLYYNQNLSIFHDLLSSRLQDTQDDTLFNFYQFNSPLFYNFWNGSEFETLYGLPSGSPFVGQYKIDNEAGVIILDEYFSYPYIVLEYISSPKQGGDYYIPVQFQEALIWYLAWHDISMLPNTRRGNLGDKEQRRHNYFNERRLARARYKPVDIEAAYEWNLRNQRLTVKA